MDVSSRSTGRGDHAASRPADPFARAGAAERAIGALLERADVRIDGDRPWDIQVHDRRFFSEVLAGGSLALGESYMAGAWDCERLDELFARVLAARLDTAVGTSPRAKWSLLRARLFNLQRGRRAFVVGERHYDLGNDFFEAMLDGRMTYSCGYWRDAATVDEAQEAKLDLICRKLGLREGQSLLDIGCGWGSLAGFAAERCGVQVLGVTVSREQAEYAKRRYADLPVEIRVQDYRDVRGTFDHIASVGMFEHVGHRNHRTFMEVAARLLAPEGSFLLHTIGSRGARAGLDPWIERYVFPNSGIPSAHDITAAAEGLFILRDWHAFGHDYDPTLMAWHANCDRRWREAPQPPEECFRRMWRYYLLMSAGSFRADDNQVWQILFTKPGARRADVAVR